MLKNQIRLVFLKLTIFLDESLYEMMSILPDFKCRGLYTNMLYTLSECISSIFHKLGSGHGKSEKLVEAGPEIPDLVLLRLRKIKFFAASGFFEDSRKPKFSVVSFIHEATCSFQSEK